MDTLNRNKVCASIGKKALGAAPGSVSNKVLGLLKSTDHGKFSTRGDYSAATVRGTAYCVEDTCAGTLTTVTRGSVVVDYFRRHKTIVVKAGPRIPGQGVGRPERRRHDRQVGPSPFDLKEPHDPLPDPHDRRRLRLRPDA